MEVQYNPHMKQSKKWYVYVLSDMHGKPFYVGKGCRRRLASHFQENSLKKINLKNSKIKSLGLNSVRKEVIAYFDLEESALATEEWLIRYFGLYHDGGILYQHKYSELEGDKYLHTKFPSSASRSKTTDEEELKVKTCFFRYFTNGESLHLISEELGIRYATARNWVTNRKHKVLYEKYITQGLINVAYPLHPDHKLYKGLSAIKLHELRKRWNLGETVKDLASEINYNPEKLKLIFFGESCLGLFTDYSEFPDKYKTRSNISKRIKQIMREGK